MFFRIIRKATFYYHSLPSRIPTIFAKRTKNLKFSTIKIAAIITLVYPPMQASANFNALFDHCRLYDGPTVFISRIIDGDTIETNQGEKIRLLSIQAPELNKKNNAPEPFSEEAKQLLSELVLNKQVRLMLDERHYDRFGRILAQVISPSRDNPKWFQQEMLRHGMAHVYTFQENRKCSELLLKTETEARKSNTGLWSHQQYQVKNAAKPEKIISDQYQIVQGLVLSVGESRGRIFINFGKNWKNDFTATIASDNKKQFSEIIENFTDLKGKKIEIRGWVFQYNGPSMELTHPEQIVIISDENNQ